MESGVTFSAEVSVQDVTNANFQVGAQNSAKNLAARSHVAQFEGGNIYAMWSEPGNGGSRRVLLGAATSNATYSVEVEVGLQGTKLLIFDRALGRASAFVHELHFTDWGTARTYIASTVPYTGTFSGVRIDNVVETRKVQYVSGALYRGSTAGDRANDLTAHYFYDTTGRQIGTLLNGNLSVQLYDSNGRLVETRLSTVPVTSDSINRLHGHDAAALKTLSRPSDRVEQYFYDGAGHVVGTLDQAGIMRAAEYDVRGNVVLERISEIPVTAALRDTVPSYDAAGVATLYQAGDLITRYYYDSADRLIGKRNPEGLLATTEYHANGTVARIRNYATPTQESLWAQDFRNAAAGLAGQSENR
jgi:YD repeat-containing protein